MQGAVCRALTVAEYEEQLATNKLAHIPLSTKVVLCICSFVVCLRNLGDPIRSKKELFCLVDCYFRFNCSNWPLYSFHYMIPWLRDSLLIVVNDTQLSTGHVFMFVFCVCVWNNILLNLDSHYDFNY